jgi:hypothetical protein
LITYFKNVVTNTYQQFYKQLGKGPILDPHPGWKFLREQFDNPNTKFLKYRALAWMLSPLLQKMDEYTRYPMPTLNNTNITFLNLPENRKSCLLLEEMIGELIELVPLVRKQIESLKSNTGQH